MSKDRVDVINSSLVNFILEIHEYLEQGYELCNEDYPQLIGRLYQAVLYKEEKKSVVRPKQEK